jgi:putative transposase
MNSITTQDDSLSLAAMIRAAGSDRHGAALPVHDSERSYSMDQYLRRQAQRLIGWTVDEELDEFLRTAARRTVSEGRAAVVRNGYQPQRRLHTSVGPVEVRIPKVRTRLDHGVVFRSALARPYLRRARWVAPNGPIDFLLGIANGDIRAALRGLMGPEAGALPVAVLTGLTRRWKAEFHTWLEGPLGQLRCASLWLDCLGCAEAHALHTGAVLMAIGEDSGRQRLLAAIHTSDPSADAWHSLLAALQGRGLQAPQTIHCGAQIRSVVSDSQFTCPPRCVAGDPPHAAKSRESTYTRFDVAGREME